MNFFKNNYFQSKEFEQLNEIIFNNKIIKLNDRNFFILRNKLNLKKLRFTLKEFGTEFKGILEFYGQPVDFSKQDFESELDLFLKKTKNVIKKFTPGIVIFRVVDIENKSQLEKVNKIFFKYGYLCRSWLSNIINIPQSNEKFNIFSYNTRREIRLIENLNILVEEVKNFKQYELYINLFFNSYGHLNYPNKKNYFKESTWNNLKKNHYFFIIKINNEPFSVFGVRIYNNRGYWCMVGRLKKFKYSLHSYSIYFLLEYLKKKKLLF
jgi:hypothetical protein